jgi:hypothetical protein
MIKNHKLLILLYLKARMAHSLKLSGYKLDECGLILDVDRGLHFTISKLVQSHSVSYQKDID